MACSRVNFIYICIVCVCVCVCVCVEMWSFTMSELRRKSHGDQFEYKMAQYNVQAKVKFFYA